MLPRIFSDIINGVWAIEKSYADAYIPLLTNILEGKVQTSEIFKSSSEEEFEYENRNRQNIRYLSEIDGVYTISEYGDAKPPEKAPKNSIAILNIIDVVSKYDQDCGPSGTVRKGNLLQRADSNPNIKGIILNIDSPGGEGYAAMEFSRIVRSVQKPVIAFIDDLSASAAYWISSSTDWIVANSVAARIGSIGTYVTLADYEEFYNQKGIRLVEIYADKSSDKNKAYYDAIRKGDFSLVKQDVNKFNDIFLESVSEARKEKLNPDQKIWGTGKIFDATEALSIGLIDEISTWEDTLISFANSLNIK
jgi:signal peptide peptidase SppA